MGRKLALVWSDPQHPEEVFVAKAGQEPVKLTCSANRSRDA